MKTKMIIALTALTLTACTSNLHALTKSRTFAQAATTAAHTAVNYARQNKLKTAGMIIGGAIALDALQVGARWSWWRLRKDDAKIKAAREAMEKADKAVTEEREKRLNLLNFFDKQDTHPAKYRAYWDAYAAHQKALPLSEQANCAYKKLLFDLEKTSIICIPLLQKLVQQTEKFHAWRYSRNARRGL